MSKKAEEMMQDFVLTDEDEEVLSGLRGDTLRDPVTGRKESRGAKNMLNKKKLNKHEMDEFFMDF